MLSHIASVKLEFHDADTDTDTDILAMILAMMSARMSVSVSVLASWNSSLMRDRDPKKAALSQQVYLEISYIGISAVLGVTPKFGLWSA